MRKPMFLLLCFTLVLGLLNASVASADCKRCGHYDGAAFCTLCHPTWDTCWRFCSEVTRCMNNWSICWEDCDLSSQCYLV